MRPGVCREDCGVTGSERARRLICRGDGHLTLADLDRLFEREVPVEGSCCAVPDPVGGGAVEDPGRIDGAGLECDVIEAHRGDD